MASTVKPLVEHFYAFMEGRNAQRTIDYYRTYLDRFVVHVKDAKIEDLRKHHLLTFSKSWHAMQAVQRLFTWAHSEAELIKRDPFKGVKRPKSGGRRRVLSKQEIARLLRGATPEFRNVLIALRDSIARPQEIRAVTWESIRWEGDYRDALAAIAAGVAYFELWEYKSRRQRLDPNVPRVILITKRLGKLLIRLAARSAERKGPIFRNHFNRPWTSNAIRLRMRRLCRRLKIDEDNRGEPVVAYTFRHTAATNAAVAGVQDRILAEIMGHTSTRTTARYQHLTRKHLRDAMDRLEDKPR